MSVKGSRGDWLPFEVYKNVGPYIELMIEELGRPMSYEEVHSKLFDILGTKMALSYSQIGGHVYRSKKLSKFRIELRPYVTSKEAMDKFMAGKI